MKMTHTPQAIPRPGFTLVELLTVIAIIGVLAAILIPVVGGARISANKAKTRVQFNQYATALQEYRTAYGYWPKLFRDSPTSEINLSEGTNEEIFIQSLSGRNKDGTPLSDGDRQDHNRRGQAFYSFSSSEFEDGSGPLVDAFGNTEIFIAVDQNGDGIVSTSEGAPEDVRAAVAIWVEEDRPQGFHRVRSWE